MDGQIVLMAVAALFGGLSFTLYPVCVAHTNDHIEKSELVQASGGLILSYSAGATIGPLAGSAVMSALGGPGLFVFTAAGAVSAVVFGLYRVMKRPPPPAEAPKDPSGACRAPRRSSARSIRAARTNRNCHSTLILILPMARRLPCPRLAATRPADAARPNDPSCPSFPLRARFSA